MSLPAESTPSAGVVPFRARILKRLRRVVYVVFVVLTDAYGVLTTLLLAALLLLGGETAVTGVFKSLFPGILLPALVAVPGSALIRRWRLVAFSVPALVVFVWNYGVFFVPRSASVPPDAPRLSLLTFNLHSERYTLAPMVALIREASPDVVGFQELQPETAEYFTKEFAKDYPYQAFHPLPDSAVGQGVMSRYPLSGDVLWTIEGRSGFQHVDIDVNGRRVMLFNIHPHVPLSFGGGYNGETQTKAVQAFLLRTASEFPNLPNAPVIISGDMNMNDQYEAYREMTANYQDTYREIGWGLGLTFPDFGIIGMPVFPPLVRVDYVFHNDKLRGVQATVWHTSGGSDHRPLFVQLAFVS